MNAQEAIEKTDRRLEVLKDYQYEKIQKLIGESIGKGKYFLYIDEILFSEVKEKLIRDGYIIKDISYKHYDANYRISWEKPEEKTSKKKFSFFRRK